MRLFISISVPAKFNGYLKKFQNEYEGIKKTSDFHITIQFLGNDIDEEKREDIIESLSSILFHPFEIVLGDAMPFGHPKNPEGIWTECHIDSEGMRLASNVRNKMKDCDFVSNQPFRAHITLGRYTDSPGFFPNKTKGEPHSFVVKDFSLIQSQPSSSGSKYKAIETFVAR